MTNAEVALLAIGKRHVYFLFEACPSHPSSFPGTQLEILALLAAGSAITRTRAAGVLWRRHEAKHTSHWGRCAQRRSCQEG